MFDDDTARGALRILNDEPMPPASTTLDEVLRRGRRRVFVQRASAVAGVMAVVAAIGVGALLLQPGEPSGVRVGTTNSASPTLAWPNGWERIDTTPANGHCPLDFVPRPPQEPDIPLLAESVVSRAFVGTVRAVIGNKAWIKYSNWQLNPPEQNTPRGIVIVDVLVDSRSSQFQLEAGRFGDTPPRAADWWGRSLGACEAVYRRVLADGTVLQLYPAMDDKEPTKTVQQLQIFGPDGRMYTVSAGPNRGADTGTNDQLPVTEGQLAAIAEKLMAGLG